MSPRMPQVTARLLVASLRSQGFEESRQRSIHLFMIRHADCVGVTVPIHSSSDLGRGLAARFHRDAGFTVDEFLRLR